MDKERFINIIWEKFKLIRIESNYTQEEMADILGISKKTLVQIEKGRVSPSWTTAVAICALFRNSEILHNSLGGDPVELLEVIVRPNILYPKDFTFGGKIWWVNIHSEGDFRIQQNMITQHYRILDSNHRRWLSTLDLELAKAKLKEIKKEGKN